MSQARPEGPQGLGELLGGLASDFQTLVRGEIALARAELGEKAQQASSAGGWIVGGALLAFAGLVVTLEGVAQVLSLAVTYWLASLIVGIAVVIGGIVLARTGLGMLSAKALTPDRTAASLTKDAAMLKEHV